MVRQCVVCKKVDYCNPGLIFRRFPVNPERRQRWVSLLNLENQHVFKYATICSNHFDKSDIMVTELTGRRQIRPNAEPQIDTSIFDEALPYRTSAASMFQDPKCHDPSQEVTCAEQSNLGSQTTLASPSACPLASPLAGRKNYRMLPKTTETASKTQVGINWAKQLKESQKEVYRCSTCSFQTPYKCSLYNHKKVHLFACAHCGNNCRSSASLEVHLAINHIDSRANELKETQNEVYRCATCSYQTPYKCGLNTHKKVHLASEERQLFACLHCDNKYRTKQSLEYHFEFNHTDSRVKKLTVSQDKVYRCSKCSFRTAYKASLNKHKKIHLAPEKRKLFACAHCDKKYKSRQGLNDHLGYNHISSRNADCISATDQVILDSLKIEIDDHAPLLAVSFKNAECLSGTNEVKSEGILKTEPDDVALILSKEMHNDFKGADCIPLTPQMELDSSKIEIVDHILLLDDFKNAQCLSGTSEVKSEEFIKIELDDVASTMNKDMHNDFKNAEYLFGTKEVKSEDFLKIESDDEDMHYDYKNTENFSVTKEVKLEDLIKMEHDYVS
ncbi:zinc finger protein 808-like isoform X3 [Sitophilus oryzae]|uniref:Zinc finger protein 808-like isoform X3 n=1 Tax=Sitophilus oryzae TaxID=7048 RepID=A0A6J2X8W2_SITOR|nr:zinc finger protein 808-like isoform X3 [Sitophilus oryzae]